MGKAQKPKRVLVTGDWHCGHEVGLTPPEWASRASNESRGVWKWFEEKLKQVKPIDLLILNGDAIDGRGERSGSVEQIALDRSEQVRMAFEVVRLINPRAALLTYGTAYHTGREEDWEEQLYNRIVNELNIPAKIGAHETAEIGYGPDKLLVDVKHKVGGSQVPHTRHTAIARERLWNVLWAEVGQRPKAQLIIRSHAHYYSGTFGAGWMAMILPALQGLGSRYGARECSGLVDVGFVVLDVVDRYNWGHQAILRPHDQHKAKVFVAP